jgi:hypothetical protein
MKENSIALSSGVTVTTRLGWLHHSIFINKQFVSSIVLQKEQELGCIEANLPSVIQLKGAPSDYFMIYQVP